MNITLTRLMAFAAALFAASAIAQAPAAPGGAGAAPPVAELEKLVGRIALYPDDLVAVILPASTNPLQLVQADRFLEKRKTDKNLKLDDKWDDAVKTLLNYPEVVKMMSNDLDWTSDLGEAVVADLGAVMEAVQVFRRKTQSAGNLKSDGKQNVVVEQEVIKIVSADPQVIYVPQYNPSTVVVAGAPYPYAYYPPYPSYYYPYPPGAALATGIIWGAAIGAIWNGGHYGAHYGGGGNNINIDNSVNVNRGSGSGSASQRPAGSGSGSSQWKSNKQPGQVSSSTGRTQQSARVGDTGGRGGAGGAGSAGGARPSTQPAGGGRDTGGGGARPSTQPSGSAFGGAGDSGRQAQMDSSRGASSRGTTGQGARQVPPSGGAGRASMGGGRSGGGGGGGGRAGGGGGRGGGRR